MSVAAHIEKIQEMMDERMRHAANVRAHELALVSSRYPLRMLPIEFAIIGNQLSLKLQNLVCRANADQFDRLTDKGFRLNFLSGEYEKPKGGTE